MVNYKMVYIFTKLTNYYCILKYVRMYQLKTYLHVLQTLGLKGSVYKTSTHFYTVYVRNTAVEEE